MAELAASAAVNPVAENTINAIGRQFGYLWNYRKNMDNLEKQVTALESKIIDRERSVNVETRNAKETSQQVKNWLSEARIISGQARSFIDEHKKRGELRCLVGRCPNPVSRYQFGRKACKIEKDVADVITKEVQITEVSFPLVGQDMSTEGFFTFDSRKSILDNILKALQDESKRLVGLYGFGGMGKTTLARQVASRAKEGKLFEEIVFASVTQKVDVKEIQGQFATMLGLNLVESTVAERANHVRQRLKEKKVLVILDDLWKELDLKEVGVDFGAEHMGCKILLTSRFRHVLNSMGTGEDFNLGALDDEEAWRLFEEKVGGSVLRNSGFHNIGKKVAKKCQGLPVLIVTVAASLSKRPQLRAWNDALNQLENMNHKEMHDIVNSAIESISYNHLENTHKNLFLLCGVLGGFASIEDLLQYSLGWDLFDNPTQTVTIQKARDRLHALILDLKESCLLLDDVDSKKSIKMHDVVRDVAISIGSKDLNMLSIGEYGDELNIWRKDEHRIAMVLRGCPNLPCLPQLLECPSLELFVIKGLYDSSPSVPESFFEKTDKLKVLGISKLSFTALPPSLSFLKNLQTLRVNDCDSLKDISIVGELKKLQILSFAGSGIEELPSGIGQLSELRSLDVRRCSKLKVIPAGLIEGLTRLEELYVSRDFNRWGEAEECNNGSVKINASFKELKHLRKLCSLEITVGDLPEDLYFEKLESYEIIVGVRLLDNVMYYIWWWLYKMEVARKIVWLGKLKGINHLQYGVKMLFKSTECLLLGQLSGIKNVLPALDGDGFPNLKHLRIEKDSEIQYVVNVEDTQPMAAFPSLESLHLIRLWNLQKISNGPLMEESFYNLTSVEVKDCNVLKSLFSFSMATGLSRLQEMEVSDCDALEGIVAEKNVNDDSFHINDGVREEIVEFAQLRKLTLRRLPKLKNFVSNGEIQNKRQKSLQESEIHTEEDDDDEGELKYSLPFFTKVSFPKLEKLVLYEIPNLTEIWSHRFQDISFCNLTIVEVGNCNVLKSLFSFSMATGLSRLQEMEVSACHALEAIVAEKNVNDDGIHINDGVHEEIVEFAQLRKLTLRHLPKLKNFISIGEIQNKTHKSLQESEIHTEEEEEVKSSLPFFTKVSFPKLEKLILSGIPNLNEIWSYKFQEISFCNLTTVEVGNCNVLKSLFSFSMATGLSRLQEIKVSDCGALEGIVAEKNVNDDGVHINDGVREEIVEFAQLRKLNLSSLPKLKNFVSNGEIQNKRQKFLQQSEIHTEEEDDEEAELKSSLPFFTKVSCPKLEELQINQCHGLKYMLTPYIAMGLVRLRSLEVSDCVGMKHLVFEEEKGETNIKTIIFPQLSYIHLNNLPNLTTFYSEMSSNENLDTATQPLFNEKVSFPKLEKLILSKISNLIEIWSYRFQEIFCCNLTTLKVEDCNVLKSLFYFSMSIGLSRLQEMEVSHCDALEGIVAKKNIKDNGVHINDGVHEEIIEFAQLRTLTLSGLPKLKNFISNGKIQNKRQKSLQESEIHTDEEYDEGELKSSLPFFTKVSFSKLEELKLSRISRLKYLLTPSVATSLVGLKSLEVYDCAGMKHLVVAEEGGETNTETLSFPQLRSLCLKELSNLTSIYLEMGSNENLDTATQPLFSEKVSFPRLEKLKLFGISSLKYLLTPSIATSLVGLESLEVKDCAEMKHLVVAEEEGETNIETITFPQLRSLCLEELPNLTTFYSVIGSNDTATQSLFSEKVSFPRLEKLELSGISSFKYLLTPSVVMGLVALESLKVKDCARMKHIVVAEEKGETNIETTNFPQLSSLCLEELSNLTTFYLVLGSNDTATQPLISEKVSFPKLKKLELLKISNLTEIWSHKFQEISCCNLKILIINTCKSLKHVFPAYVARSTNKLEYLRVEDCEVIETIIGDENHKEEIIKATQHEHVTATFMFAKLTTLYLLSLPKVKCFYPRKHTIECPLLGSLNVEDCGNLSILDLLSFPPKEGDDQFEKVMSNSEYMSIRSTDLEKIRDLYCHFPPHLFSSLESLTIVGSGVFQSEFLGIIHKQLRGFAISNCSFQEIFPYEREFTNHAGDHTLFLPKLISLSLEKLPQLKYICKHDQKKSLILNILGRIVILKVEECPRLTNLVQPSTARSLKQLLKLTISGCEMMEKIIGDDDDDDGHDDEESSRDDNEIIFPNLLVLILSKLPMLTNFCSSLNYTFNFPKLRYVEVRECPNMKTFCVGITTTPNLKEVKYEDDQERWEGDLNTTVQKVFAEMEAKRLGKSLPSDLSSNHVEAKAHAHENSSEELTEPILPTVVQIRQNQEKEPEVYENSIETETFKVIVPYTREKGKGKEPEVSEEVMEHSNPSTHSYTAREQTVAGSVASSSKSSSHSEEFHERPIPSTSSSSNNQEAEIHDQTAEPTKEPQICKHVVDEISEQGTFTENAIEPRIATEISEDSAEKSVKLEVRELAPLLPSTNHIEAAAQAPKNLAKAQNDATNVDKMEDTFETGSLPSSEETNPPAQTTLSLSTELDVRRSTHTVESEATDPTKAGESSNHSEIKSPPRTSSSIHFIPLLSEFLQIIQNQPLKSMSAEHVQFMENAFRDLSTMNFSIEWFIPYVQKARECLPVLESRREISELESEIAKMEAELEAAREKKKALEEKYEGVASRIDLDKSLHDST